jgi:hypothetical protein
MLTPTLVWTADGPQVCAPVTRLLDKERVVGVAGWRKEKWEQRHLWGFAGSYKPAKNWVEAVRVKTVAFECHIKEAEISYLEQTKGPSVPVGPRIDQLILDVDTWFQDLATWIETSADQGVDLNRPTRLERAPGYGLHLVTITKNEVSRPAHSRTFQVLSDKAEIVTYQKLRKVMSAIRNDTSPNDAQLLMRDARAEFRWSRYRKAVIDAGAAVELCLADFNHRATKVNTPAKPTLGWYIGQPAIAFAASIPSNARRDLLDVRNNSIHMHQIPTATTAHTALTTAQQIVDRLAPLWA